MLDIIQLVTSALSAVLSVIIIVMLAKQKK